MQATKAPRASYYRLKSEECSALAGRVKDPIAATVFRAMAIDYLALAKRSCRRRGTTGSITHSAA
jgi:hypothetical protein